MMFEAIGALLGAGFFAAFHVPVPHRRDGQWQMAKLQGKPARVMGVLYHICLLPAIAALPAPVWAVAAGLTWMLLDIVLDAAGLAGTDVDVAPFRSGVHVVASLWLVTAGWTAGPVMGLIGTTHAAVFMVRLVLRSQGRPYPGWVPFASAWLNIGWMVGVAITLANLQSV